MRLQEVFDLWVTEKKNRQTVREDRRVEVNKGRGQQTLSNMTEIPDFKLYGESDP